MLRTRRTRFAAPFVACITVGAAGCGATKSTDPVPPPPPGGDARASGAALDAGAAVPPPAVDAGAIAAAILRRWEVQRRDGTCAAYDDPCVRMRLPPGSPIPPCNPPAPQPIPCPVAGIVAIVEVAAGDCRGAVADDCLADPRADCADVPARPTPCPAR